MMNNDATTSRTFRILSVAFLFQLGYGFFNGVLYNRSIIIKKYYTSNNKLSLLQPKRLLSVEPWPTRNTIQALQLSSNQQESHSNDDDSDDDEYCYYYAQEGEEESNDDEYYNEEEETKEQQQQQVDKDDVDADEVSDAIALLACRAYLQRKNRLGQWKDGKQRKRDRLKARKQVLDGLATGKPPESGFFTDVFSGVKPSEYVPSPLRRSKYPISYFMNYNDLDDDAINEEEDDEVEKMISNYFTGRSKLQIVRSRGAKKRWNDPEWKAKWYENRWGKTADARRRRQNSRKYEKLIRAIPSEFVGSPELANMTEDEIREAIETYVVANRKRSAKRYEYLETKDTRYLMKDVYNLLRNKDKDRREKIITKPNIFSFYDPSYMKEIRKKRSEKSKRIYATRLRNQKAKENNNEKNTTTTTNAKLTTTTTKNNKSSSSTSKKRFKVPPPAYTPTEAISRIETYLDHGKYPDIEDIRLIMIPGRLANRKELIRRILDELFDIRGKHIPTNFNLPLDDPNNQVGFVTTAKLSHLANYIIHLIKNKNKKKPQKKKKKKMS